MSLKSKSPLPPFFKGGINMARRALLIRKGKDKQPLCFGYRPVLSCLEIHLDKTGLPKQLVE